MKLRRNLLRWAILLIVTAGLGLLLRNWVICPIRVTGTSMSGTLRSGDIVLATRFDYRFQNSPKRGEIVQCTFKNREGTYIKRVIGLPGDAVSLRDSVLTVNGRRVSEPYANGESGDYTCTLGDHEYLVLGDNRAESYDSRAEDMGTLTEQNFIGRVRWIIWPLNRFGPVY